MTADRYQNYASATLNGLHIFASDFGKIIRVDAQTKAGSEVLLPGEVVPPVQVSVSEDTRFEGVVVVDGAGHVWLGQIRGNGAFEKLEIGRP